MANKTIVIIRNAAPQDFGGGERFPVFLAEILQSTNYTPIIVSRSEKLLSFADERKLKTIKGWWWKKQQWSGKNNALIGFYFAWQGILFIYYVFLFIHTRPQAVHIQSKDDFIAATYAAHTLRIRSIWTDHADLKHIWKNTALPFKNPIGKWILKAAKKTHTITVVSRNEESLILDNFPEKPSIHNKFKVIYNGVLDVAQNYPRAADTKKLTYLIASRLVVDKGIREAIRAFKILHNDHPENRLVIIGDGPDANMLKKQARDCSAITFLGHQKDPLLHMAAADVFIHPTYHEGFSVALVEASMMNLPIIATSVGGNKEIVENKKTGLLVPQQDSEALAAAMIQLHEDGQLRRKLGSAARKQYLAKYQFNRIVKKSFIPLYDNTKER